MYCHLSFCECPHAAIYCYCIIWIVNMFRSLQKSNLVLMEKPFECVSNFNYCKCFNQITPSHKWIDIWWMKEPVHQLTMLRWTDVTCGSLQKELIMCLCKIHNIRFVFILFWTFLFILFIYIYFRYHKYSFHPILARLCLSQRLKLCWNLFHRNGCLIYLVFL